MKTVCFLILFAFLSAGGISAEIDKDALAKLTAKLGHTFWSAPDKRLVRATTYKKGNAAAGADSQQNKSNEKIALRYASAKEAGTLAVPDWLPRGSMVKIHTEQGAFCYIAADEGSAVESRKAAKESGKTKEQRAVRAGLLHRRETWPDFIIVEIYYYAGKIPFTDLTLEDQKTLFAVAMEYVSKRE